MNLGLGIFREPVPCVHTVFIEWWILVHVDNDEFRERPSVCIKVNNICREMISALGIEERDADKASLDK